MIKSYDVMVEEHNTGGVVVVDAKNKDEALKLAIQVVKEMQDKGKSKELREIWGKPTNVIAVDAARIWDEVNAKEEEICPVTNEEGHATWTMPNRDQQCLDCGKIL